MSTPNNNNFLATLDATAKATLSRLAEEEEELRKISPIEGALGRNHSDYHSMWNLFTQIVDRANVMNQDPAAFVTKDGFNEKTLSVWTKMISTAKSILEGLNKMRNNDKMMSLLLEDHTKAFTQSVCIELGVEIKRIIEDIDEGSTKDDIILSLKRLMYKKIPHIFTKSATSTLAQAKEDFSLI